MKRVQIIQSKAKQNSKISKSANTDLLINKVAEELLKSQIVCACGWWCEIPIYSK